MNAQHLLYEAQIGHHYGVSDEAAIASLTSVPAVALGMDHRIGYLREGYDADVVIWDSHPLALGATPIQVFIDGVPIFDEETAGKKLRAKPETERQEVPAQRKFDEMEALSGEFKSEKLDQSDFIATGIQKLYLRKEDGLESLSASGEPLTMVVREGKLICLSTACDKEIESIDKNDTPVYRLDNGHILPGLTVLSPGHGLLDIESEITTMDGIVDGNRDPTNPKHVIYAKDGLKFDGKHLERAQKAGILNLVTAPLSSGFLQGVSVAFKSGGKSVLDPDAVIQEEVTLHFALGSHSNRGSTPSISSQIATLRDILINSANDTDTVYGRAANGKIPIAIATHNKDAIAHLLKMKSEIADVAPIKLVIIGGIESYLLAKELAAAKVPVILAPWRCQPESWESRHCLPGPPIAEKTSFQILVEHDVEVALAAWDDGLITTLYWEAGWAAKGTHLEEREVVGLISTGVEKILGIEWDDKTAGGHVLFEGNPLDFGANIIAVF